MGFQDRLITRQMLRAYRNPKGVFSFFIGNLLWAVILSIVFLSFIMKLLYIRGKRFFVEHMILLMHIHSFIFIFLGFVILIIKYWENGGDSLIWISFSIAAIYFLISMFRYYGQGIIKTFIKFFFIGLSYLFIITIFASIILLISMFLF